MAKKSECNVPGCKEPQKASGVCKTHHSQNYVLSCCETLDDGSECDREVFAKSRCKPHYMRRYRRKQGLSAPEASAPVREYGQKRHEVFTRIPEEHAKAILKAAGRRDGMYTKAAEILCEWAERYQRSNA